jgi:hypothetical protein
MVLTPKLCTVVADCYGNSSLLQRLKKYDFVWFITPEEFNPEDWDSPVLIYGYGLAKELYDSISIGSYEISEFHRWTFNEFESKPDVYIEEWIRDTADLFFQYDSVVGEYGDELDAQIADLSPTPFIFVGNHEVYICDHNERTVISWTHEEISYRLDTDPYSFTEELINLMFKHDKVVVAWSPENIKSIDHDYMKIITYITDRIYTVSSLWLTKEDVVKLFKPIRKLTTPEFMIYASRAPQLYEEVDGKDYLRRVLSGELDQFFSRAQIYIDRDKLLAKIKQRNTSGVDAKALEKLYSGLDTNNTVQIPYCSRNKVTARMFPTGGVINPVNVSDRDILECITSRFDGGFIASFDFKQFEPRIIMHLLEVPAAGDIHQTAAGLLDTDRESAKKLNNMILYGAGEAALLAEFRDLGIEPDHADRYLQMMSPIVERLNHVQAVLLEHYIANGFYRNPFGRIIRPRNENGVFNNYIQTTASDMFNEASWKAFKLLRDKHSELFMHRFDALYADIHPGEADLVDEIADTMRNLQIQFDVQISTGPNLASLKAH